MSISNKLINGMSNVNDIMVCTKVQINTYWFILLVDT
jgi:hypothetical protein